MFIAVAALLLIIDQIVKIIVEANAAVLNGVPLIGNLLKLTYVQNTGAAFNMLAGKTVFLIAFCVIAVGAITWFWWKTPKNNYCQRLSFSLIVSGAIGNVIDRIRLGYVVDFLQLPHWPVFNLADCFLVVGVALLCISLIRDIIQEKRDTGAAK